MVFVHYLRLCHTWLGLPSAIVVLLSGLLSAGFQTYSTCVSKPVLYFTLPSDIVNTDNDFDF